MKQIPIIFFAAAITIIIFVIDISFTSVGYADWLLYFIPLFIAAPSLKRTYIPILPSLYTVLIILSYFLSPPGGNLTRAAINRAMGIFALWWISFLIIRRKQVQEAFNRSCLELEQRVEERTRDLKRLSERNELIMSSAGEGIFGLDLNGNYTFINKSGAAMLGYSVEEMIGKHSHSLIHFVNIDGSPYPEEECKTYGAYRECNIRHVENEVFVKKDGTRFPVEYTAAPLYDKGKVIGAVISFNDITQRKKAEEEIEHLTRKYELILENAGEGILGFDTIGRTIFINQAAAAMLGYEPKELIGKEGHAIFHYAKPDGSPYPSRECPIYAAYKDGVVHTGEEVFWRKDGTSFPVDFKSMPYKENGITGAVVTFSDITERKKIEEEMRHMAYHDSLTGLPNRRLFLQIINVELAQARRHETKLAVLFLDLDRFKEINDTLGHEIGDELLKEVSVRLKRTLRESDTVSRMGGDEFNLILPDIDRADYAADVARKVLAEIRKPFSIRGYEINVSTSIGISIFADDSEEIVSLLRYADIAMYHAKENGRNTFQFYNAEINTRSIERLKFESYLRQALARGEMVLHYQPQVKARTRKVVGAEALIRWRHPELGLLEPKQFIHAAEGIGFINTIDEWVLRTACAECRKWIDVGHDHLFVAVNMSSGLFQSKKIEEIIESTLEETGLPADLLEIEITESVAMSDIERTGKLLRKLSEKGIKISIDDFGTGYSSLNYLKQLPIQKLKIDRTFVKDIANDPDDRAIIKAISAMAHNMKMRVIAEGVETEEQLSFLTKVQCDEAQGYLVSRSLPAEEFRELIALGE